MQNLRGKTRSTAKDVTKDDESSEEEQPPTSKKQKVEKDVASEPEEPKLPKAPAPPKSSAPARRRLRASYLMKLFDRSVDLAKFSIEDPLYPICREWMRNGSRNVKKVERNEDDVPPPRRSVPEVLTMVRNGIAAEIKFLPPKADKQVNKVPELMDFQKDLDKSRITLKYDLDKPLLEKDEVMRRNMLRWKMIRENWQTNIKEYETQYEESFEILDSIYKKSF